MKQIYFLSGLPRSGSTVLAAILNQHPDVHASSTSGLLDMLVGTLRAWADSMSTHATVDKEASENEIRRVLQNICETKYSTVEKPIILDKARGWASNVNIQTMGKVFGYPPKIIATVRNVEDCAASFVRVAKPENLEHFLREDELIGHLKESYQVLEAGYRAFPQCILFVDYDELLADPKGQLSRVHEFLGLKEFDYDLSNIDGSNLRERDEEVWMVKGLHDVKPVLAKQHDQTSEEVLDVWHDQFVQPRFWKGETVSRVGLKLLDQQLAAGLTGNLQEGWRIAQELAFKEPWNHRAAFNRGWYMMWQGHLQEGQKLMDRGRIEKVYGNGVPSTPMPLWDGVSKGTVLLNLEGGLGDQIHGVRFAREIADRGCEVIVACSGPLAMIFRDVPGVKAVVQHEAVFGVVHDFWVPSMSAIIPLGYEYADLSGKPYISKPEVKPHYGMRIGLRWQGNPQFEHEQHRLFPPNLMFDALKDVQADFICLQRDEGSQHRPPWIREVPLNHWEETRQAIASCDLVISSCTSVAHLSAAMGVPTWIVVPILPYYLWAKPGKTSPWYDSVTLFRQEVFGDWTGPFKKISSELSNLQKKQA